VEKCTQLDHRKKLSTLFIIGNACRDTTYRVAALPRPGETTLALATAIDLGGKGFNQAIATRRAGQALRFIAAVGIDSVADEIRASLMREGIDGKDLVVHDGQSDSSIILVDETGENLIVSGTARAEALAFQPVFAAGDTLLLQGNLSRHTTHSTALAAKTAGATVVLNAAPFREWLPEMAEHIDILVVNELELYLWTGRDPSHPLDAVMQAARVNTVVTTLGSKGCLLRLASGAMHSIAIPQTNVIDTTGAGDVFTGTYVSEWMASRNHLQAATLAVHVASDKVRRLGSSTAFPSTETIDRLRRQIYVALPLPQATP
jgi:ribokinase